MRVQISRWTYDFCGTLVDYQEHLYLENKNKTERFKRCVEHARSFLRPDCGQSQELLQQSTEGGVYSSDKPKSLPPAHSLQPAAGGTPSQQTTAASAKLATTLENEKEEEEKKEKKEIQKEEEKEEDNEGEATVQAEAEKPYVCASCSKTFSSQQASYATA